MNIADMVREFIIEEILFGESEKLADDMSFYETGIIDSTGILEIISFIEKTFNIDVEDDELIPENFDNVQCIARFLERKSNSTHIQ